MSWKSRTLRQSYGTLSLLEEGVERARERVRALDVDRVASVGHDDQLGVGQRRGHLAADLAVFLVERADQQQRRQAQLAQPRLERRRHAGAEAAQAVGKAQPALAEATGAQARARRVRQAGLAGEQRGPL